jgi:translation initiation factor 5
MNGSHEPRKIQSSIYEFIDSFVLCSRCTNPETEFIIRDRKLGLQCSGCGYVAPVQIKSNYAQKLADWITSHIDTEGGQSSTSTAAARSVRAPLPAAAPSPTTADPEEPPPAPTKQTASAPAEGAVSIIPEELKKLQASLEPPPPTVTPEEENTFLAQFGANLAGDTPDDVLVEAYKEFADKLKMPIPARVFMIFSIMFKDEPVADVLTIIVRRRAFLIRCLLDEPYQKDFLYLMSKYICEHRELMSSAPVIWYALFDNEIIEEEAFKNWVKRPSSRFEKDKAGAAQLRELVKPFMTWLETAQFEPEPDDTESEDEEEGKREAEE